MQSVLNYLQTTKDVLERDYKDGFIPRNEVNAVVNAIQIIEEYHYGEKVTEEVSHNVNR